MFLSRSSRSIGAVGNALARQSRASATERFVGPSAVQQQQRTLSQSSHVYQAAASASATTASNAKNDAPPASTGDTPKSNKGAPSVCVAGTTLTGLNIYKDRADPVAKPDDAYPAWLWTILEENKVNADGLVLESTDGLSKGEARIVEKRNLRIIRAAYRAKERQAALAKAAAEQSPAGAGMNAVGQTSQGVVGVAGAAAEAVAANAAALVADPETAEREKKRELRKANRAAIKSRNFVKAQ